MCRDFNQSSSFKCLLVFYKRNLKIVGSWPDRQEELTVKSNFQPSVILLEHTER